MSNKRTPIGNFIHSTWTALNIRCCNGKYNHIQTQSKCKHYKDIYLLFTQVEYKEYCYKNVERILLLKRPSIDRIDNRRDYSIENIQFIELSENIAKEKLKTKNGLCECYSCKTTLPLDLFCTDNRRKVTGKTTLCKQCDGLRKVIRNENRKLGSTGLGETTT